MAEKTVTISFRLSPSEAAKLEKQAQKNNAKSRHEFAKRIVLQTLSDSTARWLTRLTAQTENLAAETAAQASQIVELQAAIGKLPNQLSTLTSAQNDTDPGGLASSAAKLRRDFATATAGLLVQCGNMSPKAAQKWTRERFRP